MEAGPALAPALPFSAREDVLLQGWLLSWVRVQARPRTGPEAKSTLPRPQLTQGGSLSHPLLQSLDPTQAWPRTQTCSFPASSFPGTA